LHCHQQHRRRRCWRHHRCQLLRVRPLWLLLWLPAAPPVGRASLPWRWAWGPLVGVSAQGRMLHLGQKTSRAAVAAAVSAASAAAAAQRRAGQLQLVSCCQNCCRRRCCHLLLLLLAGMCLWTRPPVPALAAAPAAMASAGCRQPALLLLELAAAVQTRPPLETQPDLHTRPQTDNRRL
jgi:hypothetical protein